MGYEIYADNHYYRMRRERDEADYAYEQVYSEMCDELKSIGYNDDQVSELDAYIEDQTHEYLRIAGEFDAPMPHEWIRQCHEDGEIEEWLFESFGDEWKYMQ